MVARRLLIALILMLVISSFAAALVPVEPDEDDETTETQPVVPPGSDSRRGRLIERTVDTGRRHPPTVQARVGDHLVLTVKSQRPDQVEIPALGELADADPLAPAVFDLVPFEPARYPVSLLEADRRVATIVVEPPARDRSEDDLDDDDGGAEKGEGKPDREASGNR